MYVCVYVCTCVCTCVCVCAGTCAESSTTSCVNDQLLTLARFLLGVTTSDFGKLVAAEVAGITQTIYQRATEVVNDWGPGGTFMCVCVCVGVCVHVYVCV